jgi:hypothetical protein
MSDTLEAEAPHPYDFAEQLIRQLVGDLDGILFDNDSAVDEAFLLLAREAGSGAARGATLVLLASAALSAHRVLVYETAELEQAEQIEIGNVVAQLVPEARAQLPALFAHADRLSRTLAVAEQGGEPITSALFRAIVRFYEGLRTENEILGGRALIELRSMTVHIDATAAALESVSFDPRRVIRPDRFHDWFMQYASLAQSPEAQSGEQAVATLTREGKITAVVTEDTHPLEVAARKIRELIPGDDTTRDHALARIRALLDFIDSMRKRQQPQIGDAQNDQTVYLSLVIAAATAPLDAGGGFRLGLLGQIARYNRVLLQNAGSTAREVRH